MALPAHVTNLEILRAMEAFDNELRSNPEWANWVDNENYKFAIFHDFKIYPVKHVISLATGIPKDTFSGGKESNDFLTRMGFAVISLRDYSWAIRSGNIASKTLDKSAFTQGTGIPVELRPFFLENGIEPREHKQVTLICDDKEFPAYITMESSPTARTRLFWNKDFIKLLASKFPVHYKKYKADEKLDDSEIVMNFERVAGYRRYLTTFGENRSTGTEMITYNPETNPSDAKDGDWAGEELKAAVKAYLWMLEQEMSGNQYSKAEVNRSLRENELSNRSKASVEYRMQNISAVLEELCMPRIKGYLPAKNLGTRVKDRIKDVLQDLGAFNPEEFSPTADPTVLDQKVRKLRTRSTQGIPRGIQQPQQASVSTTSYVRDPLVKAWVLENAKGICEGCDEPAPFVTEWGEPFLEEHHVNPLAEGGSDTITNAVALCPNCHRRCHVAQDRKDFSEKLYSKVKRLVPE